MSIYMCWCEEIEDGGDKNSIPQTLQKKGWYRTDFLDNAFHSFYSLVMKVQGMYYWGHVQVLFFKTMLLLEQWNGDGCSGILFLLEREGGSK